MRMHRWMIAAAVVAVVATGAAGCSNAAPGADSPGDGSSGQGSKTLRLNYGDSTYLDAAVAAFRKANPDLTVQVTHSTLNFEDGSVQTNLRSGRGADAMLINSGPGRIGPLAKAGLIADLTDVYRSGVRDEYSDDVLDQITSGGKIHEVVEGRDIFELHYDSAIFEKAGVDVPTTWTELLATCKPLAAAGVRPLIVGARDNFSGGWLLGTLVQSSAGASTVKDAIFGDGSFTDPAIVEGSERVGDLLSAGCLDGKTSLALDNSQALATFGQGKAAMIVAPQSVDADLREDKVDTSALRSIPMPSDDSANAHPTSGLAVSWVANAKSAALPAAKKWMRWVTSSKYLSLAIESGYTLAPARDVPAGVDLDAATAKAVKDVDVASGYNPSVYLPVEAKDAWYAAVQGLLSGQDAEPLLEAIDEKKG